MTTRLSQKRGEDLVRVHRLLSAVAERYFLDEDDVAMLAEEPPFPAA